MAKPTLSQSLKAAEDRIALLESRLTKISDERDAAEVKAERATGAADEARRIAQNECKQAFKQLDEARAEILRLEVNLARALGYIDRINEDEPEMRYEHVGDIGQATLETRRGPHQEGRPFNSDESNMANCFRRYR